ncbi:MAG TPA: class I SAM-dependent methyltransferase [Gemmataceae bacterium]|nr:class I SAM-dependent methyltransferase [Gemmataceae bacterium]
MNIKDWDRYWSEILADVFWKNHNLDSWIFEHTTLHYIQSVEKREGHRVLLAGNGISPEPFGLSHAGIDVTVVEVSEVACEFLSSFIIDALTLGAMFPVYDEVKTPEGWLQRTLNLEKSATRAVGEKRAGGNVAIVKGDLFEFEPDQLFDAIISKRAYQGFPADRRQELANRFFRWLRPRGIACVLMHNIRDREPYEAPFHKAGFARASHWTYPVDHEKQVLFWHGSG